MTAAALHAGPPGFLQLNWGEVVLLLLSSLVFL
jgi:hypothetical protein